MRRLAFLFVVVPVAALSLYGCDEAPTHPSTNATASETTEDASTPLFVKGGNPKSPELPSDCTDGQTIRWVAATSSFECADLGAADLGLEFVDYYEEALGTHIQMGVGCSTGKVPIAAPFAYTWGYGSTVPPYEVSVMSAWAHPEIGAVLDVFNARGTRQAFTITVVCINE